MPQNEADRIIHERKLQQQRHEELEKQRGAQEAAARAKSLGHEIEAEMSVVFKLLADKGYPFAHEATIITWKFGWLGGRKATRENRAAWYIGKTEIFIMGDRVTQEIELLSDGRIRTSGDPRTVKEIVQSTVDVNSFLEQILHGLQELRAKVEAL